MFRFPPMTIPRSPPAPLGKNIELSSHDDFLGLSRVNVTGSLPSLELSLSLTLVGITTSGSLSIHHCCPMTSKHFQLLLL